MAQLTVLGIGNILMRDEGVGVHLLPAVRDARPWPADVEFIDGGAGGLNLLNVIEEASRMVVFDAADLRLPPGECRVISPEQVCADTAGRMTMHDMPFLETLQLCGQFSRRPAVVRILAIQPKVVDHGRTLSDELTAAMPALLRAAVELVEREVAECVR